MSTDFILVMAGGSGTRFWPRSRASHPKQLVSLDGKETLLEGTLSRLCAIAPAEKIFILTNQRYVGETATQASRYGLAREQILAEPVSRDTAACIGLAAVLAEHHIGDGVMAVFPADHRIYPLEKFQHAIDVASALASEGENFVTLGIQADRPAIEYGYIEQAETRMIDGLEVSQVVRFMEKPDRRKAEEFLRLGNFKWNAGIFLWKVSSILSAFRQHLPEHMQVLNRIAPSIGTEHLARALAAHYPKFPRISVDYGIMEKVEKLYVVTAPFHWDDLGSWISLERLHGQDAQGNTTVGKTVVMDSRACIVDAGDGLVGLIGVENLVVVRTGDAVLICHRDRVQEVKDLVSRLDTETLSVYR